MKRFISIFALSLSGCASLSVALPDIDAASVDTLRTKHLDENFKLYLKDAVRLGRIGNKILISNAPLCPKTQLRDPDIVAVKLSDFPKDLRDRAKVYFSWEKTSDLYDITSKTPLETPTGDTPFCDYRIRLSYSPAINAYVDSRRITVATGMVRFSSDDELAFIIGHELAHNARAHVRKIIQNTVLGFGRGVFARKFESEADYLGLYFAARAGYSIEQTPKLWERMAQRSVKPSAKATSHPIYADRIIRLESAISQIVEKSKDGVALIPEDSP